MSIVKDLTKNHPEIWYALLKKYNLNIEQPSQIEKIQQQLTMIIVKEFPEKEMYGDSEYVSFENFEEFFNIVFWNEYEKSKTDIDEMLRERLLTFFYHINKGFMLNNSGKNLIDNIITEFLKYRNINSIKDSELFIEWEKYFEYDIISPRGLWIAINWVRITTKLEEKYRLSWYFVDTLLIYTLINSDYFKNNHYQGWICNEPFEVMIYEPEKYGKLIRLDIPFDFNKYDCTYDDSS